MQLQTFPVGPFQCNCSVLTDPASGTAVVVDPGDEAKAIAEVITSAGLRLTHVLHTHAHVDHVGGTAELKRRSGGTTWLHKGDQWLAENLATQCAMIGLPVPETPPIDRWLEEGTRVDFAGAALETLHTPGHTPGSCCFVLAAHGRQLLFAGDTLFAGSIGRTDLWGGDTSQIMSSLRGKLLALDDDTEVVAGHGPGTSIGRERRGNPFLTGAYPLG
ncbi:MAG TPA: MBL fold metallo-hydrolase [Planctomycetota bacterium]|nr:MBL fold metallo-hydrolase [Planctomycetota bacterium]